MEKQKQISTKQQEHAPQIKIRSSLSAGGSVEACMKNLKYWRDAYNERCLLK